MAGKASPGNHKLVKTAGVPHQQIEPALGFLEGHQSELPSPASHGDDKMVRLATRQPLFATHCHVITAIVRGNADAVQALTHHKMVDCIVWYLCHCQYDGFLDEQKLKVRSAVLDLCCCIWSLSPQEVSLPKSWCTLFLRQTLVDQWVDIHSMYMDSPQSPTSDMHKGTPERSPQAAKSFRKAIKNEVWPHSTRSPVVPLVGRRCRSWSQHAINGRGLVQCGIPV